MSRFTLLLMLSASTAFSQPYYTPVRGAIGVEVLGISPKGQVYAEALFGYRPKSFWDVSAGFGAIWRQDFKSFTLSSSLTHAWLLNPRIRKSCQPHPVRNKFEAYFEGGGAVFFADTYDVNKYLLESNNQRALTPLALVGLRFHFISEKWIYLLKVRYTPALLESRFSSRAGVAFGIGWR